MIANLNGPEQGLTNWGLFKNASSCHTCLRHVQRYGALSAVSHVTCEACFLEEKICDENRVGLLKSDRYSAY